ncbi:MAG: class I SAM-dependent methyltransferase [Gemmatimonadota bacterium]
MLDKLRLGVAAIRNVILGTSAAALPLLTRPYQLVRYSSESRFLLRAITQRRGLPELPIAVALGEPGQGVQDLTATGDALAWGSGVGSYVIDILSLCAVCRIEQPRVYFEIGTLNGFTVYHAALNSPGDARLYTLDLPPEPDGAVALTVTAMDRAHIQGMRNTPRLLFEGTPQEARITRLFGDSATFDYTPYRGQVDVFFIDGAHSYEYVRSDTLKALECCHAGSVILWHDFGRAGVNGVSRWLLELRAAGAPVCVVPGGSLAFMILPENTAWSV